MSIYISFAMDYKILKINTFVLCDTSGPAQLQLSVGPWNGTESLGHHVLNFCFVPEITGDGGCGVWGLTQAHVSSTPSAVSKKAKRLCPMVKVREKRCWPLSLTLASWSTKTADLMDGRSGLQAPTIMAVPTCNETGVLSKAELIREGLEKKIR